MTCDTAFRVIARRYLADVTNNQEATRKGDSSALHQMRIALTHLRTAILFFSPMLADTQQTIIMDELKWLNGQLGVVRDLDVAIERLAEMNKKQPQAISEHSLWKQKSDGSHRHLAQVLGSLRYRRLIKKVSDWIENGRWSTKQGKHEEKRAALIIAYSGDKLTRWRQKLLKKSRRLGKMSPKKRHRLRLLNKKLTYSIDFFQDLVSDKRLSKLQEGLKYLRKVQKSLGQLNDDANAHSLAAELQREGARADLYFLSSKRQKRLLRTASAAYRRLGALNK
jgi:CHAD domain-containing protein